MSYISVTYIYIYIYIYIYVLKLKIFIEIKNIYIFNTIQIADKNGPLKKS